MNRTQRSVVVFSLAGALTFFSFGCDSFTGGGWIPSAAGGNAKATFGLALTCTDNGQGGAVLSGTVEYQDHGFLVTGASGKQMSLALTATLPPTTFTNTCEQMDASALQNSGSITFTPSSTCPSQRMPVLAE